MYLFLLATLASCQSCSSDYKDVDDIVVEGVETPVLLGDPFIMLHDGTYYAYGTHADEGIEVYTSDDLKTWAQHLGGRIGERPHDYQEGDHAPLHPRLSGMGGGMAPCE